ncbi:MAG: hypothetical protein MUP08_00645 [Desulfobulbaceae bacterium]|nr:hypothetical protein [Desulfobulbaceae bacterium]
MNRGTAAITRNVPPLNISKPFNLHLSSTVNLGSYSPSMGQIEATSTGL